MQLPPGITEDDLIRQCKNGDIKPLEMLYKRFYGYAMGIGLRYCANRDDALEVVNDGFIKLFNSLNSYDPDKPFKAWLRRIIVNTAIDKNRREKKHLWNDDLELANQISTQATAIEQLNARDILNMLNKLPDLHRVVFNLYEIDGYSHDDIAALLAISASSSRVYLSRGKERLRELITKAESHERRF
ncbi:RNA polymerase sigma-70 factor (ECF subfamily) [Mucilaginibacter gracilis]|uniref:RNA polymerase sigma-70 factor (ECF subfamily) n=1 Tax=Mucilaginibacter gracilis TaxID=423350 RepID=A0A495J1L6_9SPHI|nr:sigma-70 family RNA polymerase sigma factor [Mucilaginibacter gracilis]RKR82612.1 RNA polymerase sigma-70 factor (ECF subfamily) [Mucilaginibacter gracilis]